jgi:Arc/MetJ-type ribon-helix-helix transcriptional regulator
MNLTAPNGMMVCHTIMPKTRVALTLDAELLEQVDDLVAKQRFRNRSQAVEAALADKLRRLARTRLARESAKLNPDDEKRLADEGLTDALESWPEY